MAGERAAADAIASAFADPELLKYAIADLDTREIPAIRHERAPPQFGDGGTNRRITYEIQFSVLPEKPSKRDTFIHRGTLWRIGNVATLDDVFAWDCDVTNGGPA